MIQRPLTLQAGRVLINTAHLKDQRQQAIQPDRSLFFPPIFCVGQSSPYTDTPVCRQSDSSYQTPRQQSIYPVVSRSSALWCGEGNGTPLQYTCLENPMDGGAWCAAVHGVTKSWTRLSDFTFHLHALEKEMATHSSVLAWRIRDGGVWWAATSGVAQSQTQLK